MADARLKKVMAKLADLSSRTSYVCDILNNLREPLGSGDLIEVPQIGAITVVASGSVDTTAQTITPTVTSLNANLDPAVFVKLPKLSRIQLLGGGFEAEIGEQMLTALKNYMDSEVISYLGSIAYDTAGSYVDNGAASGATVIPTITLPAVNNCVAAIESLEGVQFGKLAWFIHPFAKAAISAVSAFSPIQRPENVKGFFGVPQIGWLNEIPVYVSQAVPRLRTIASTAWAITGTTTHTITVAAGHNAVPGMVASFDTVTAGGDVAAPGLAVSSVTATTIVLTSTGLTNATATEAGTITLRCCENKLIDTGHSHVAQQLMPSVELAKETLQTGHIAQVTTIYGRLARAARVRTLLTTLQAA